MDKIPAQEQMLLLWWTPPRCADWTRPIPLAADGPVIGADKHCSASKGESSGGLKMPRMVVVVLC